MMMIFERAILVWSSGFSPRSDFWGRSGAEFHATLNRGSRGGLKSGLRTLSGTCNEGRA
jgi:hypothetical protein